MAVVQGIKEKVHLPIYDCVKIEAEEQLRNVEKSSTLKFFVDVQGKTKLETNLQSASLLPHYNTFEARALRVVLSDLPPQFPTDTSGKSATADVLQTDPTDPSKEGQLRVDNTTGKAQPFSATAGTNTTAVSASIELGLDRIVDLLKQAHDSNDGTTDILPTEEGVTLSATGVTAEIDAQDVENAGGFITFTEDELQAMLDDFSPNVQPLDAQILSSNGDGSILSKIIYNTVTTFYVGEKVMIEMPTWFFPAGAGPFSDGGKFSTHGEPNPLATFRFAEAIFIDRQQNFRVEIDIPDADVLKDLQRIYGPLFIWVVLDGYMTRGVQ